ncbi:MAG: TonB C-terminal domain-containing protein [Myxococcota bacterium]
MTASSTLRGIPVTALHRTQEANQGFGWVVGGSLVLHAFLMTIAIYTSALSFRAPNFEEAIPVELVQLGKPRDPKLLPRKVKPPPPPPDSDPAVPGKEAPGPDAVALDTDEKDRRRETKPERKEPELSPAARRLLRQADDRRLDEALAKIDDPEGAADGFEDGTTTDPNARGDAYLAAVKNALEQAYHLPETIPRSERPFLQAVVLIRIAANGRITSYDFVESHPNQQFLGALRAMLERIELPPPPADQAQEIRKHGIQIRFKPRG